MDEQSHARFNPLTRQSILVSPHRAKRPWLGQVEEPQVDTRPQYDTQCYLCPGNKRVGGGEPNPQYQACYTFPNDFPALQSAAGSEAEADTPGEDNGLFQRTQMRGECRVICYHPDHSLTMARMSDLQITQVIREWQRIYTAYRQDSTSTIGYVQLFENKGAMMGCSNPHPHGQCWALERVPEEPMTEFKSMQMYRDSHAGKCLLCVYTQQEVARQERVVYANDHFVAVVPYWATWPYETMVLARQHVPSMQDFTGELTASLAACLSQLTCKYDNLFKCPFPYSAGIHQAPIVRQGSDSNAAKQWMHDVAHWHMHFYPPLLRSATVRKFLVGFEMLGMPQRDLTAEQAAARLRECDGTRHYSLAVTR